MSWSKTAQVTLDELAALDMSENEGFGNLSDEAKEQFALAKRVAADVINSGVVGQVDKWQVNLSGHANPEHKATPAYANDCVTISVAQAYVK